MDNLNTNVDDYSNNELFDLAELNPQSDKNQIENHFTKIIQGYMGNNDYKMAQFFHDAKEKILSEFDDENENNNSSDQASDWFKSNYRQATNKNQQDKITDRRHEIGIFDDNSRPVMTQKRLGISNTVPLEYSQDSLNPTLRQTTFSSIYIDSSDRENTIPFINNPTDSNSATNFVINLTEPLKNVLSIKLESINIPKSINAFDSFYDNNSMLIYVATPPESSVWDPSYTSAIDYLNNHPNLWGTPTRIHLTSGTYDSPIQFINQFNLDLSHCAPARLKSGTTTITNPCSPYPGNLQLQAHLLDGLNNNPRIVFINTTTYVVKLRFYQTKFTEINSDISDCAVPSNLENRNIQNSSCSLYSTYKNNLGYLMGYRIWRDNSSNKIYNSDLSGNTLEVDLSACADPSVSASLIDIYNNLGALDVSYTMTQYSRDIYSIINTQSICNNQISRDPRFFGLSTVPLDLTPAKYIYLCVNDFQQNRTSGTVIRTAIKGTKLSLPSYANRSRTQSRAKIQINDLSADIICDVAPNNIGNGDKLYVPAFPRKFTLNQIYALNMINSDNRKKNIFDINNIITDSIATIPFENSRRVSNVTNVFAPRKYFGPVKLERLQIQLKDENGNYINLNGSNWGFNLIIEQLYQY